ADRVAATLAADRPGAGRQAGDQAVASAVWDLVWAGRLTKDKLAPLRTVPASGRPVPPEVPAAAAVSQAVAGQGQVVPPRPAAGGSLQLSGRRGPGRSRRGRPPRAVLPAR